MALLALLGACVPAARPDRTVEVQAAELPVRTQAGTSLRLVFEFGYGDFGLDPGDLEPLPLPEVARVPRESVTGSFFLRAMAAPEGWSVELDRVTRVIEPLGKDGSAYSLELALRVGIPPDAAAGTYAPTAQIWAQNGVQREVRWTVQIP